MNERIRQLADEAGLRFTQLMSNPMVPVVDGKETDLDKFAELIIQECVDNIQDHMSRGKRDDYYRGQSDSIELIKTHFGVKE
jgi:hypothetical protein